MKIYLKKCLPAILLSFLFLFLRLNNTGSKSKNSFHDLPGGDLELQVVTDTNISFAWP